eukprot:TRINITY_DN10122_c0_g2_i5.p2 TRINITY_DN10122_c0_g2~~TRINITY_DN10122_c0_g2_i5.p2  ORF type:complete len:196 (+),score=24.48 TRINITY_DN10122_c0_g2_i5:2803-3390(+)
MAMLLVIVSLLFGYGFGQSSKTQSTLPKNFAILPVETQKDIQLQLDYIAELKQNLTEEYTIEFQLWNTGFKRVSDYKYTIERILRPAPAEELFNVTVCSNQANATDQIGGVNTIEKVFSILKADIDSLGNLGDELYAKYNKEFNYPEEFVRSTSTIQYDFTEDGTPFVYVRGPIERGYKITNFQELGVFTSECSL